MGTLLQDTSKNMDNFKPMLCCSQKLSLECLDYPVYVSPKYDGVRGVVLNGKLLARSGKPIPNVYTRKLLEDETYNYMDGELVVSNDFNKNQSAFMSAQNEPDFVWYVFDYFKNPTDPTKKRLEDLYELIEKIDKPYIKLCPQLIANSVEEINNFYNICLEENKEGIVIKYQNSPYKFGRSTLKEGCCLKMKKFDDAEGQILDVLASSKKKDGKVFMKNLKVLWNGKEITIGSGFNTKDRYSFFNKKDEMKGRYIKFKYNSLTNHHVPRFPVYVGMRDIVDM